VMEGNPSLLPEESYALKFAEMPTLTFLPVDRLLIHERHDPQRTPPLIQRIRRSGMIRNPPIVSPLIDGSGRYMVLDGANRVTALKEMHYPHALVQVVEPGDPGLKLYKWSHVVWEMSADRFLKGFRKTPGLILCRERNPHAEASLEGGCGLALVYTCRGNLYSVCTEAQDLESRVELLHAVVDSYREHCRLDRTNLHNIDVLRDIYPQFSGLVVFPEFSISDIMKLCSQGYLLPSGITRFAISPRALHLNYPLEEFAPEIPLEEKNERLHRWLQDRLARKGVRYYAEATFLFDE
jgi:hypothetical protein